MGDRDAEEGAVKFIATKGEHPEKQLRKILESAIRFHRIDKFEEDDRVPVNVIVTLELASDSLGSHRVEINEYAREPEDVVRALEMKRRAQ